MSDAEFAVIGGGIAGLTAARRLAQAGRRVAVFDKGRGVSGRSSTRYAEAGRQFDHGAQYFTVRSPEFAAEVSGWIEAGVAAQWVASIGVLDCDRNGCRIGNAAGEKDRYVGAPGMNEPARQLAREVIAAGGSVSTSERIASVVEESGHWRLVDANGKSSGQFGSVLVTCPAPQAAGLLAAAPELANAATSVTMTGCWAAMVSFAERVEPWPSSGTSWDAFFVNGDQEATPLSWMARDSSKPGRPTGGGDSWVLHGSPIWSEANLEIDPSSAAEVLLEGFWKAVGATPATPQQLVTHRWRFALPSVPLEERFLADRRRGLFAAGDWCGGPRIEGAYLSGLAAAEAMLASE